MLVQYPILKDLAGILMVGVIGWLIVRFISRGLAWFASAAVSGLMLLVLAAADLAQFTSVAPAVQMDLLFATSLVLLVHLVSDVALYRLNQRIVRASISDRQINLPPGVNACGKHIS